MLSKDNIAVKELTPNSYQPKAEENKDNEHHVPNQKADWNKTAVLENRNIEKLHEMATKSNSDNEVEETGYVVRENVSTNTLVNVELHKENDSNEVKYSNKTRIQIHDRDNTEKENSVSEKGDLAKEIHVAGNEN